MQHLKLSSKRVDSGSAFAAILRNKRESLQPSVRE